MLTGEMLGTENAEKSRRRHVPEGVYRAVLVAGVQPASSGVLLNEYDVSVGTPQRFVWALTADPSVAALTEEVAWPGALQWGAPVWPETIEYPDHVKAEIRHQARAVHQAGADESSGLDGHARLTRLKVAALLAFLHEETEITERWWALAGDVMAWSAETVHECRTVLGGIGARKDRQAGESAGRRRGGGGRVRRRGPAAAAGRRPGHRGPARSGRGRRAAGRVSFALVPASARDVRRPPRDA